MTGSQIVAILNVSALFAIMLSMGLQVPFTTLLSSLRQTRIVVLCLIANYILVPAVTLGLLRLLQPDPLVSIGFFILAVCPGAPVSPTLTAISKGNLSMAVGMMTVLAGSSAILAPALLGLLLTYSGLPTDVQIDYLAIARILLIIQILPLAIGLALRQWTPNAAARWALPLGRLANLLLIALVVAIIATQYEMFALIRLQGWLGMGILLLLSLGAGWIAGGRSVENRKAMAMTTAPRNAAVGLAIATGSFANTPAVTAVVAYGLASMLGSLAIAIVLGRKTPTLNNS